jgi:hypothetical protein
MMRGVVIMALSLAVPIGAAGGSSAEAQAVVKDPAAIGFCLCQQQRLDTDLAALRERQQTYDSSREALEAMNRDLAARRGKVNVYDNAEVDAYRQSLEKRDSAAAAYSNDATPSYNAAIARYNQSLSDYNGACAGKSFDQTAYNTARTTLSCPKP